MMYVVFTLWILVWAVVGYFTIKRVLVRIEKKRIENAIAEGFKLIPKDTRLPYDVLTSERVIYSPYYRSFFMK